MERVYQQKRCLSSPEIVYVGQGENAAKGQYNKNKKKKTDRWPINKNQLITKDFSKLENA